MNVRDIISALESLDPEVDEHWTEDGAPRLDVVGKLMPNITRAQIRQVAPLFSRAKPVLPDIEAAKAEAEQAQLTADELMVKAKEAQDKAAQKAQVAASFDLHMKDAHDLTRANMKWIQSQNEQDLLRLKRQQLVDQTIRDAGGLGNVGPHPLHKNTAARIRAARKNRVLPAPPQGSNK